MSRKNYIFTSESVSEGHPDKVCDRISDAVLDACLSDDPESHVACECFATTGMVLVGGEITTETYVDIASLVRDTVKGIGYTNAEFGLDFHTCAVLQSIDQQSSDIAMGVDRLGAGDQGMMFGYATKETDELMPMPILLAHKITRRLAEVRKNNTLDYLRPDGKSQVSVRYEDGKPVAVETVVLSTQHNPDVTNEKLRSEIIETVIRPVLEESGIGTFDKVKYHINPTGRFVIGGPQGDAGLTGRKIIVDTYGGMGRHGGGAFSGKDPTKVDRSAAYAARWVAKNIVAAGLAERCELQLAYAIGVVEPVSVSIDTFGTNTIPEEKIEQAVSANFDLTPSGIIKSLQLRRPIYQQTAAYGHFGRNEDGFTWELTDRVDALKA